MVPADESTRELVGYLRQQAGPLLRGVVGYGDDGHEFVYLRDDVEETRTRAQLERMLAHFQTETREQEEAVFPFGELHGTVRCFDEAVLLHFPLERERGVIVALDADAARDLSTFAGDCLEQIYENPPV